MKLGFNILDKNHKVAVNDDSLTFACLMPIVIQSTEIQKVRMGIGLQIHKGCVLSISTHSALIDRAAEVFPALISLDHTHGGELFIPVRNNGRNPLNLLPGQPVANGHLSKIQKIETHEFELDTKPEKSKSKTKPQKKNPNIQFEVR